MNITTPRVPSVMQTVRLLSAHGYLHPYQHSDPRFSLGHLKSKSAVEYKITLLENKKNQRISWVQTRI